MLLYRKNEEKAKQPATRELLQRGEKVIQIPPFYGEFDPNTYLEWERGMDFVFHCHRYTAEKQVQLATTGLCGYAFDWWHQLANHRRHIGEFQVSSWYEMKAVMKKRFVAKKYGQLDLERLQSQSRSVRARPRTSRDEPKVCYGRGDQKRTHQFGYLHSQQFQDVNMQEIQEAVNALVQDQQRRPDCDTLKTPAIQPPEEAKQSFPNLPLKLFEMKEETAAEQGEIEQNIESEPTILCKGDYLDNHLKQESFLPTVAAGQEGETQVISGHVPDQTKKEEGVLRESSTASELVLALVDQGDNFKTLTCELLIRPMVYLQLSLVEHLRVFNGLQQVVFEPGGSLCVFRKSHKILEQKAAAFKLNLHTSFTLEEQDLWSNPFEGREDGVIQTSCYGKVKERKAWLYAVDNDLQTWIHHLKQEQLVIHAENRPKLKWNYGDCFTRPPDNPKGFLQDQNGAFMGSYEARLRVYAHKSMRNTWIEYNWREAVSFKLNRVEKPSALEAACIEKTSKMLLRHEEGLQYFVFDPGETQFVMIFLIARPGTLELTDHGSIYLQDLDLRTNPYKGEGDGTIVIRLKLKVMNLWYGLARLLIKAWLNGKFQGLTGMIYEVLDREKDKRLDMASGIKGMIKDQYGRPACNQDEF